MVFFFNLISPKIHSFPLRIINNCFKMDIGTEIPIKYPKRLAAFDFDYTIVNDNTDRVARDLLYPGQIPAAVQQLAEKDFTRYMGEVFSLLHERNFSEERIKKSITDIVEVPGMVKVLKTLKKCNFDLIIISDSNSVFINEWNKVHGLSNTFDDIFTNPAWFQENGMLKIKPFHHQTECKISPENLCKGKILQDYITRRNREDNVNYHQVFYVGDGTNDICPVLRLNENDYGCARKSFQLDKRIGDIPNFRANLLRWATGFELLREIMNVIDKYTIAEDDNCLNNI